MSHTQFSQPAGTADNTDSFPADGEILDAIELPDGLDTQACASNETFAGYAIIATFESKSGSVGLLIADRTYQRLGCVLYPVAAGLQKYVIEVTDKIEGSNLNTSLKDIERKLALQKKKIDNPES